jgi:membrane protease YdiL (CAAX protease family)
LDKFAPIGFFLMAVALSVMMSFAANLARFGVIAPILLHAAFNTQGHYFAACFATRTRALADSCLSWRSICI